MRISTALACLGVTTVLGFSAVNAEEKINLPVQYNEDGSVDKPLHYRQWVNVGTFILPKGAVNIIDLKPAETAEALDTYVEPHTYAIYMATGVWPEGAQLVKEFTALAEPAEDGSVSESHFIGLSYIIKDSSRFPDETANLGYFQFGHKRQLEDTASLMPRDRCSFCHEENASYQQNIFADRHIGLKRD
jgi:hypothetical protein